MKGRMPLVVAGALAVAALWNCTGNAGAQPGRPEGVVRVATYNVQWFSEDANPGRVSHLKSVLKQVNADVIGFQEIQSKRALDQILGSEWEIGIKDDPSENQEPAIAVRKPLSLVSAETVFPDPALDEFFPGKRDVLRCVVQTRDEKQLVVYVVHMKSRRGGRLTTDHQRIGACGLLAAYIHARSDEQNVIVLGDFNDSPSDQSVNILETGDLMAKAGPDQPKLLVNLTEPLEAKDYVTESFYEAGGANPVVKGAKADNDRLRGKDYQYPQDVNVKQAFFDQILASTQLAKGAGTPKIYAGSDAVTGSPGSTAVTDGKADYKEKGDLASDHLPVFVDLLVR